MHPRHVLLCGVALSPLLLGGCPMLGISAYEPPRKTVAEPYDPTQTLPVPRRTHVEDKGGESGGGGNSGGGSDGGGEGGG